MGRDHHHASGMAEGEDRSFPEERNEGAFSSLTLVHHIIEHLSGR